MPYSCKLTITYWQIEAGCDGPLTYARTRTHTHAITQIEAGSEVVLMGMYVHEFGPGAGDRAAGRVLIECIDSIPLLETETGEERQRLLTAIIHG